MTAIAPIIAYVAIPRTPEFAAELNDAIYTLVPATMARVSDPELGAPIMMSTAHLVEHSERLLAALANGEPDNADLERAYLAYLLYRASTEHWRDAPKSTRWPALEGEAASEEPAP